MSPSSIPKFSDLPVDKDGPMLNAWGLYGKDDELGALNRLTPDIVQAASKEIKDGVRIGLDWTLNAQADLPIFNRQSFDQKIIHKAPRCVHDDVWTFNSQGSTQWDGFRHYGYQKAQRFYNGVTIEDISGPEKTTVNGIHKWTEQGIVGRGILLDWFAWKQSKGEHVDKHDMMRSNSITLAELTQVAEWEGLEIKFGDILFIRTGWMTSYRQLSREEIIEVKQRVPSSYIGVEQSEEVLQWVWEHFSAVAGDQPSFECWPTQKDWACHEVFLGGWGLPIGELFDLERLSEYCNKHKRYSFFLTSQVCNVPGGVASPPNALAVF